MKKALLYIVAVCFTLPVLSQEVDVFKEINKKIIQKNNIKAQTSWNHGFEGTTPKAEGYKNSYVQFDVKGNETEIISYKSTGSIFSMESFQYDEYGYNTGYVRYDGSRSKIVYKKAFKYDEKGNKLKEVGFDGASNYKNVYIYDSKGRLTQIEYYLGELLYQKRVFTYANDQNRTVNVYNAEGVFEFKMTQKFDAAGNMVENIEYSPDNSVKLKNIYKFDAKSNMIEEEKYEFDAFKYKKNYFYDAAGNLVRISQKDPDGTTFDLCKYQYDATGLLSRELYRKKSSQDFSSKDYKYDAKGICTEIDCWYASYKYRVLFKYTYEY